MNKLDQKLRETIATAYAKAPAVKARFDSAGITPKDIQQVADLVKLPIMPKDQVVARQMTDPPFGGMLAGSLSDIGHIFFSPGPIYEPAPSDADTAWDVAVESLRKVGFRPGDIVLNSFSYHLVPAGYMFDNALTRLGCVVIPGGIGNSDLQLQLMRDLSVTGYTGTGSFLASLLDKAKDLEWDVKKEIKVKKALVSAELLDPSVYQKLRSHDIVVGNGYGTAELGLLAINLRGDLAMQLLSEPIVEILNPETGQPVGPNEAGEVVATNFSKVYPLIRLGTGDLAINIDPNPGRSQQEERAIILVGRVGEAVKVRGMFVHPNQLRQACIQLRDVTVQGVQGVVSRQNGKDFFSVRLQVTGEVNEAMVSNSLKKLIKDICRVRADAIELVEPGTIKTGDPGMVDARFQQHDTN